jgi:nitrate reductase cytochrome c-type subunit
MDSLTNEDTLIYAHYNQDTSPDEEVSCLSCHEIGVLRELYLECSQNVIEGLENSVETSVTDYCLACHVSYEELAGLTENYTGLVDGYGNISNSPCLWWGIV